MARDEEDRVLIAGGGIAGLAMRRALRRRGLPSLTLERRGEPADAGLAINLPGNAVQALGQLGLGDALRRVGAPIQAARIPYRERAPPLRRRRDGVLGARRHGLIVSVAPTCCAF